MTKKRIVLASIAALLVIVSIDVAWNGFAFVRRLDSLRPALWMVPFLLLLAAGLFIDWRRFSKAKGAAHAANKEAGVKNQWNRRHQSVKMGSWAEEHMFSMASGWLGLLAVAGLILWGTTLQSYLVGSRYVEDITTVEAVSDFYDRAPWVLAENYASRDQGDDVGDRAAAKHVPRGPAEKSRYSTIITGRDAFGRMGYAAVREYNLPMSGELIGSGSSCDMPAEMSKRWGAFWPTRSLDRELAFTNPMLHRTDTDAYGYCLDGSPVVVQPLWKYEGILVPVRAAAGVAVYDASGLRVLADVPWEVQGPVFPQSVAAAYRESLFAMGSFSDFISNRSGFDTSDKDTDDTNAGNSTELGLVAYNEDVKYVTPLTPRGSSQNLTAILVVDTRNGEAVVQTDMYLPSTSSINDNIKSASVAGDLSWAARWSSGMAVYEIVPAKDGHWVASIGLGQIVNYRADIKPDGSVTVVNVEGSESTTTNSGKPLSEMSEGELLDLIEQAVEELRQR